MKQKKLLTTIVLSIVILFGACSKDDFQETKGICPIVIATSPVNTETNVPLKAIITVTFNEEMNPATITSSSFIVTDGATPLAGTISYSGNTASFTPSSNLVASKTYVGKVTTLTKDLRGNALQEDYLWSFSTGAIVLPLVIATDPANNETGVVLNKIVTATFNIPMDASTINGTTFTLKEGATSIPGTVTYSGTTALFTPLVPLKSATVYTGTITMGAKELTGIALANNYVWNFTTLVLPAPIITATDPLNNASAVALNKVVTATFNMPMDAVTISGTTFTLKAGAIAVAGSVSYSGLMASFLPSSSLLPNTTYTATVTTAAKNIAGIALANNYIWTFTTLTIPTVGQASIFGVFGGNAGITNQGLNTVINNGSIGTTAAATLITGFHDANASYTETPLNVGNVTGSIYTAPPAPGTAASFAIATQGLIDANATYLSISPAAMPGGIDPGAGELGGLTLAPGIYKSASGTFKITNGDLKLDAQGNPNAVWVFQTAAGLTVGVAGPTGAKSVIMLNGALPKNVFWYVGSAATINGAGGGVMTGTIIAKSGITFSTAGNATQTILNGRAISLVASVTMVNTTINVPN
ncbi:MAG: Ig-like domain-containing protein [Flavobacterium sp.]